MSYSNPASQVERAVRAYLLGQGKGTPANSFISHDERFRVSFSRTFIVTSLTLKYPFIPQGEFKLEIQHIGDAIAQPGTQPLSNRIQLDDMVGQTISSMFAGGDGNSPLLACADAITAAGRDLAVDTSGGQNELWAKIAANNEDMAAFRVDWIKAESMFHTRGKTETEHGIFWMEVLNFCGYVSSATVSN